MATCFFPNKAGKSAKVRLTVMYGVATYMERSSLMRISTVGDASPAAESVLSVSAASSEATT